MSRFESRAYKVSVVSIMVALVAVFELINRALPLRVPWGMSIDFVALPVVLAFFVLGTRYSMLTAIGMFLILTVFGFANFVGATMKFFSTIAMIAVLGIFANKWSKGDGPKIFPLPILLVASVTAIAFRCLVAAALNYYWAIPLFMSMPIEDVINTMFFGSIWGFIGFVSIMNTTQGLIDLGLGWFIAFSTGFSRRGRGWGSTSKASSDQ
ncbi:MAG: hypothetical protein ACQXXL_06730 [Candidatus Methanosuratincola sp.]|jgi:riboflavin transporter FmnP|nr:hypothetical protein [Candidatus Methanosuratincola sp.]